MKIAKANEDDIENAMQLCAVMDAITQVWGPTVPEKIAEHEGEIFYQDDDEQCGRVLRHLIELVKRASLGRVVYGCAVMLDPRNKLVDPDSDSIEHHPDTVAALESMSKSAAKATETNEQIKGEADEMGDQITGRTMLPCPFCGESKMLHEHTSDPEYDEDGFAHELCWIECERCSTEGPSVDLSTESDELSDYQLVRDAWNRRVVTETFHQPTETNEQRKG